MGFIKIRGDPDILVHTLYPWKQMIDLEIPKIYIWIIVD